MSTVSSLSPVTPTAQQTSHFGDLIAEQQPAMGPSPQELRQYTGDTYANYSGQPGQQVFVNQYAPVSAQKRQQSPEEAFAIQKGLQQWWPAIGNHYGTPVTQLLASPGKQAVLDGITGGLLGAGITAFLLFSSALRRFTAPAATVIGLAVGGLSAWSAYVGRVRKNGNILDLMKRLPEGATKRDLLSDPVYMQERLVNQQNRAYSGYGYDPFSTMMTYSLLSNLGGGSYRSQGRSSRSSGGHH